MPDSSKPSDDAPKRRSPARKPAARKPAPRSRRPAEPAPREPAEQEPAVAEPVVAEPVVADPPQAWAGDAPPDTPPEFQPGDDLAGSEPVYQGYVWAGAAALVIAISTLLPWYERFGDGQSAFETGTWGPVVFFLSLASVALIGLRRAGVRVALPVEEPLVHEAVGWICVAGVALKARFIPQGGVGFQRVGVAWIVALAGSFALIYLAGRMSPGTSLVLTPGWYKTAGGKIGAGLLGVALLAGVAGALSLDPDDGALDGPRPGASEPVDMVEGRLHDCAEGFPVPDAVKVDQSYSTTAAASPVCTAQMSSEAAATDVAAAYDRALREAGFELERSEGPGAVIFKLNAPRCGTLIVIGADLQADPEGGNPSPLPGITGSRLSLSLQDCNMQLEPPTE